jgi:hypothetical protein
MAATSKQISDSRSIVGPSVPVQSKTGANPGDLLRICANCGSGMEERKCKLICRGCGYFLSCSDYY